jgi:hypothetical protein
MSELLKLHKPNWDKVRESWHTLLIDEYPEFGIDFYGKMMNMCDQLSKPKNKKTPIQSDYPLHAFKLPTPLIVWLVSGFSSRSDETESTCLSL